MSNRTCARHKITPMTSRRLGNSLLYIMGCYNITGMTRAEGHRHRKSQKTVIGGSLTMARDREKTFAVKHDLNKLLGDCL